MQPLRQPGQGDSGRGFAVVADSVRQLSQRTTESADEIAATVKGMQVEVASSITGMQHEREAIGQDRSCR